MRIGVWYCWRVWYSSWVMAHSSTSPLVFHFHQLIFPSYDSPQTLQFSCHYICTDLSLLLVFWKPKPTSCDIHCIYFTVEMAPVVRIEPNIFQALLSHDDAIDDLKAHGWDVFLRKFEGYNLSVAQAFAQTFDGFRAKVGDVQLEITEDFISRATQTPIERRKVV
jgi:hypothetical protein